MLLYWLALLAAAVHVFIFSFVKELKERCHIRFRGAKAFAEVTNYRTEKDADDFPIYFPILKFTSQSGEDVVVECNHSLLNKYEDGKQLPVCYLPENPERFYVVGIAPYYLLLSFFSIPVIGLCVYFIVEILRYLDKN